MPSHIASVHGCHDHRGFRSFRSIYSRKRRVYHCPNPATHLPVALHGTEPQPVFQSERSAFRPNNIHGRDVLDVLAFGVSLETGELGLRGCRVRTVSDEAEGRL